MQRDGVSPETELLKLRQALEASEARFRNTIENNADGVLVVGRDGRIRYANRAAQDLLGRSAGELLGQTFGVPVTPGETTEIDVLRCGRPARVAEMRVAET